MALAHTEMAMVTAQIQIKQALQSKLPPTTRYDFQPGDPVQIYKENFKKWCGPVQILRVRDKN